MIELLFIRFAKKKNEITKNYVNEFKSKFKSKCKSDEVGFIGLLAFFKFQNHRLSGATIDNIIANLIVRNDKSCYGWDDFVRSESQVDVLNIHTQDDASSFIVSRAMPLTSKEVKFSPAASDQANARYLHYMHDVRFFELINNDETPIVKFTILIDNGNDNQTIDLEYEVEDAQRIKNNFPAKQWTTQDVILKSSSNIKNVQRPNC